VFSSEEKRIEAMNVDYMKKTMVENWKMDVVEMKEWCGVDRQGDGSNANTRSIVDKSLEALGNKVRKGLKKASSQWEKNSALTNYAQTERP
jgi:hypothetical protein